MTHPAPREAAQSPFALLLHPSSVPVVDVFRSKSELEFTHDLKLAHEAELELGGWTTAALSKAIISDAILLAFSLSPREGRAASLPSAGFAADLRR